MDIKAARRTDRVTGETCTYWLAGRCSRNPCRFVHGERPLPPKHHHYANKSHPLPDRTPKSITQRALVLKSGREGSGIKATHESPQRICKYWMQGNCVRGDQCWNLHSWFYGDGFSTLAKLQGHKKAITGIALPDGSDKLYSSSSDGTVLRVRGCLLACQMLLKHGTLTQVHSLILMDHVGNSLPMVVANDMLFAGSQDGVILAWKGNSATCPFELTASLKGHRGAVVCLAVGGKMLYSGSMDHTIRVWDLDTLQCTMTLNGHTDVVMSLICWDQFLLSCSLDCTLKVWVATEGGNLEVTYTHTEEHGVLALCGMTDAEAKPILFCSCNDNSVRLYELPSFTERGRLFAKQEVRSIEIGPGGLFFTGDRTGALMVWKWLAEPKVGSS
ncbi:Zinc finger CCCH domain-containing protein [Quillaja saponaria]|uniref:Zinc finger CCCH domain-containing protein n=1 Tax=Quillaja saponaria TaxID=32244 RepID=A0AAD7LQE0_QUISA|nr:Zinc finger CCCH domain-containing protein [Quillaja saponaria]